jgi:hypothetical protein
MSLELVNTLATLGTFLVISATAIAAIVQLRHARSSNQIAAINELRETYQTADFEAARQFILVDLTKALKDPVFRYQLANRSASTDEWRPAIAKLTGVGNFYESMGVLEKAGLVDETLALEIWSGLIAITWEMLAPVTAILRRGGGSGIWENFEQLTVLAQDWIAAHPEGTYPSGVRRIDLKDEWLEADVQYAASLART